MRVAPIPYDAPQETISKLFYSVNGVLVNLSEIVLNPPLYFTPYSLWEAQQT